LRVGNNLWSVCQYRYGENTGIAARGTGPIYHIVYVESELGICKTGSHLPDTVLSSRSMGNPGQRLGALGDDCDSERVLARVEPSPAGCGTGQTNWLNPLVWAGLVR